MDIDALKKELMIDPVTLGYSRLSDQSAADKLNATDTSRTKKKEKLTGSQVYNEIVGSALSALSDADATEVWRILHLPGGVDPFGEEATRLSAIFDADSTTITQLKAKRKDTVSRAKELNLGFVRVGEVTEARL